jgi:hypothetical protein
MHQADIMQALILEAVQKGFTVYAPEKLTSYFYVTKNDKIGYCQYSLFDGKSYSTVHKPNTTTGTGYKVDTIEESLCFAPAWAISSQLDTIKKFSNMEEFRRKHWQTLILWAKPATQEQSHALDLWTI